MRTDSAATVYTDEAAAYNRSNRLEQARVQGRFLIVGQPDGA